jgi:transcriptional regulator with XRE-family HTH domain
MATLLPETADPALDWVALGEFIKARRETLGLSQKAVAELLGTKQPNVWKFEHGKQEMQIPMLIKLAHALNVSPHTLLDRLLKKF